MLFLRRFSHLFSRATAVDGALLLGGTWAELGYAWRRLCKSPGFAATAILTLGLGIGASTAIFSVANAVLFRPLPYRDPGRLVIAGMELRKRNVHDLPFSNADFIDLREGTKGVFSGLAGVFTQAMLVPRENGTSEQIYSAVVTTNFFRLTGAGIVLGRDFTDQDGIPQAPAPPAGGQGTATAAMPVMAILSHEYFEKRYGGNPEVLGHTMLTAGGPGLVIVGVLAPKFRLYFPPDSTVGIAPPDVWIADRLDYDAARRNAFAIQPIGRHPALRLLP